MESYAWATDIHLDHVSDPRQLAEFVRTLCPPTASGLFLTGDISVAKSLVWHLKVIEDAVKRPVYFVLGNHDFYGAPIDPVRKAMHELTTSSQFLRYMPVTPYQVLTPSTALVGADGWYDAQLGDWQSSSFQMTDWMAIQDFIAVNGNKATIVAKCRELAHASVTHAMNGIKQAVRYHKNVIVLTHVPPFQQAHVHEGRPSERTITPWFTSGMMGAMLLDAARSFPTVRFMVLCGHTHGMTSYEAASNLVVHVGGADYGRPQLQRVIEVV